MAFLAPRSQRRAAGTTALIAAAAVMLAGCSFIAPATMGPEQNLAAATDLPTPSPARPTPSPTARAAPTASPSASPAPPAAHWRSVAKPLTAPGAWLDFGFAANGDILAIGTSDATADPLRLFVARFTPAGRKRSEHRLSRSVTPIAGDWASIDTTDDSIVIDDFYRPTGLFTIRRFSSRTGYVLSNAYTDSGINRIAIDARGRQYGLPQYGVDGNVYAAVVRLDASSRLKLGVDFWLRPLTAGARPDKPGILGFPTAIAFGLDGRVIVVDEPDIDATYQDGMPRRTAVVTSLAPDLSSPRQWELPVEWPFGSQAFGTWSHRLAIAVAADGSVYIGEPVLDDAGVVIGARVRWFGSAGEPLGVWGAGVPGSGALQPNHPAVDRDGRLWVIDVDPETGKSIIAVLETP